MPIYNQTRGGQAKVSNGDTAVVNTHEGASNHEIHEFTRRFDQINLCRRTGFRHLGGFARARRMARLGRGPHPHRPVRHGGTYTTGAIVNARYRLPNLLGNGPETRLTFYDRYYGFAVKRVGALSGAFLPATGTGFGSGGAFIWSKPTLVRVVSRVPAAVVATTPFVNMQVQITNFDEIAGCTVTIDLSLFKR